MTGAPAKSKILWGKEAQRNELAFPQSGKARDVEHVPTRRMPSDASAALWMAELETLE